jgi:hypothetical protein
MKMKLANWTRLAVVAFAVAGTQTGCKSGWKMPGTDMFSWSKKPSESTLAGSSPSLSMPSSSSSAASPVSPATKSTPNALASTAAGTNRSANPYGAAPSTSGPGFSMPASSPATGTGIAGTAASANGYTNGPYGMVSNQSKPNGFAAPPGYGAPSGYGLPSAVAQAPANAMSAAQNSFNQGVQSFNQGVQGAANNFAASASNLPQAYGGPAPSTGSTPLPAPNYSNFAGGTIPAMPAGYNPSATQTPAGLPQSSMPNAIPQGYQPSMPSVVSAQQAGGGSNYRPGSVGRSTGYDFSGQGAGSSYPSTAIGQTGTFNR